MVKISKFLLVIETFIFISACSADKEEVAPDASPATPSVSDAPTPKPNAVVKPTVQPVSKPELISFTAEDIKSIDYINIESVSSEEYHDSVASDNDFYSEKFIEAWEGQIKIGTLDEVDFLLGIYEGTSIDQDIIDSLLIQAFFIRNELAVFEDVNVKAWLINNIFLFCLKSNGACESLVEDLLSKSNQLNPVSSSYNGIVMHTKGNSNFSDNLYSQKELKTNPTPKPAYEKTFSHPDEVLAELDKHNIINCQTRDKQGVSYDANDRPIGGLEQEYLIIEVFKNGRFNQVSIPTLECALESERDNLVATYGPETRGPWIQISTFDDIEQSDSYKNSCTDAQVSTYFCYKYLN